MYPHNTRSAFDDTLKRPPVRKSELDRFKQGKQKYYKLAFATNSQVPFCLDVACGAKPFPKANVLCDLNLKPVPDRSLRKLETAGKPFVLCSCFFLPFKDKAFDFVTSYYLIEHVTDPAALFKEIHRVSNHGFVQCPTWFNELLYGEDVHRWIVLKKGNQLYVKVNDNGKLMIRFGFIFKRLYKTSLWQIIHSNLDESFHIFSLNYTF
jgi:SAM-dependent methyltransferase